MCLFDLPSYPGARYIFWYLIEKRKKILIELRRKIKRDLQKIHCGRIVRRFYRVRIMQTGLASWWVCRLEKAFHWFLKNVQNFQFILLWVLDENFMALSALPASPASQNINIVSSKEIISDWHWFKFSKVQYGVNKYSVNQPLNLSWLFSIIHNLLERSMCRHRHCKIPWIIFS